MLYTKKPMNYIVKLPDGSEIPVDQGGLANGCENGRLNPTWLARPENSDDWKQIGTIIGVTLSPMDQGLGKPTSGPSSTQSAVSSGSLTRRYKDAYLTARTIIAVGATVKVLAFVVGGLVVLVGLAAVSQSASFAISGVILGVILAFPFYVLGVLVSALGQILMATLDTAVNSSPLLTKDEVRQIMSLQ